MAVYTPVTRSRLEDWLARLPVGALVAFEGIREGIENTNYFVDTTGGRWVLTLFERLSPAELPYHLDLMRHLAARGIACPDPVSDADGALWSMLADRPAALVTRLPGCSVERPSLMHAAPVGDLLARMHAAAADFPGAQPDPRGFAWQLDTAARLSPRLPAATAALLAAELDGQRRFLEGETSRALPRGATHADLFRDNLLFDGDRIGGVIDFYFAGTNPWVYDLAVVCNDWCIDDASGALDPVRVDALVRAYRRVRPLGDAERTAWPTMLRAAALRFWLSRLDDALAPRPAQWVVPKDPAHFERILRARRDAVPALDATHGALACR